MQTDAFLAYLERARIRENATGIPEYDWCETCTGIPHLGQRDPRTGVYLCPSCADKEEPNG